MMVYFQVYVDVVVNFDLIFVVVDEVCCWMVFGFVVFWIVGCDIELGGVFILEGFSMVGIFGVVNRDECIWDDLDMFDIYCKCKVYLMFSIGFYVCMGQYFVCQNLIGVFIVFIENFLDLKFVCVLEEIELMGF